MKYLFLLLFFFYPLLIPQNSSAEIKSFSFRFNGYKRSYHVYMPKDLNPKLSYPLLLALHGGGGTALQMRKLTKYGFEKLADSKNFIIIYPQGIDKHWNDYRGVKSRRAQKENIDDVAFIREVIKKVSLDFPVNDKKIFTTGISNGAMMSFTLACKASDIIKGAATVAGAMPKNLVKKCKPIRPISILMINGDKDKLVHWEGGYVTGPFGRKKFGKTLSVEDSFNFWLKLNSCKKKSLKSKLLDRIEDETRVKISKYKCGKSTKTILYGIKGGGHTWPQGAKYLPGFLIGKTSQEFNACKTIWNFFNP